MTVSESKSAQVAERWLLWASVISLCIHLGAYGGWKWGQAHGLWKRLSLPAWMETGRKQFVTNLAKKMPVAQKPQQTPLLFIDVDPAKAEETPPQNPKFYAPANSTAANPVVIKPSDLPQVNGSQERVMKTIAEGNKSVPLQPSLAPPKPAPPPAPESKPQPKASYVPGDLALAKPAEKSLQGKTTTDTNDQSTVPTQPVVGRPRTLQEAHERLGTPTPKSLVNGGVRRLALESSMDAIRTSYGDYDRDFIDAIQSRWYQLLENRQYNVPGTVVLEFDLHSDGRISDMHPPGGDESDELLKVLCQQAVLDPAPYAKWPQKMREEVPDPRHLKFTFFYDIQ